MRAQTMKMLAGLCLLDAICTASAMADTIKVLHFRNPTDQIARDMHVTHFGKVSTSEDNNPRGVKQGRESYPSDTFNGVTGVGEKTLNFDAGALGPTEIDNYRVKINGNAKHAEAHHIVTKVVFTDAEHEEIYTMSNNKNKKAFRKNVTGFTNEEYFDLSDRDDGWLYIMNSDQELNLRYTLFDLCVYTDLPTTNFTLDDYLDTSSGQLAYADSEVVIDPGDTLAIPLGALADETYALATITTLQVEDLGRGETIVYPVPQSFAEDGIPEPGSLALLLVGGLCAIRRRRLGHA